MSSPLMQHALKLARQAAVLGEVPVGALIADASGNILSESHNLVETMKDACAHAELLAIHQASSVRDEKYLEDCDLYVTLEPCPMCAQAIAFTRLRRVYFGAYDPKGGGVEHGPKIFASSSCHHRPEIYGGILESECAEVLASFFAARR